jgi:GNAT superfamily N-acetyltransferase
MKVRHADDGDAEVIARLLGEHGYPTPPDQVRARLRALGDADRVLLAGDGAGLVALHRIPRLAEGGQFARITALVVSEEQRGQGVARRYRAAGFADAADRSVRYRKELASS